VSLLAREEERERLNAFSVFAASLTRAAVITEATAGVKPQ
jgi:hypothetical protein